MISEKLNKLNNWILSKSTIDKTYTYIGTRDNFIKKLKETQNIEDKINFSLTKLDNDIFTITDPNSVGTMIINNSDPFGFKLYGKITIIDSSSLKIRFRTKIRFEIYFFCFVTIVSLVAMIINIGKVPFWPFLFPIILIPWFNWVYMIQNEGLMKKVKLYFDLNKKLQPINRALSGTQCLA